jgi:hypothetical protein
VKSVNWYVAVLVLESSILEAWSDHSVDLQFRLIRARDAEAAYERAMELGRKEELSYENPYGQTCVWSFKGLKDLQEILEDDLADGVEVYGFIEPGVAEDHVMPREQLPIFNQSRSADDEPDGGGWTGDRDWRADD